MSIDAVKLRREHVLDLLGRSPKGLYVDDIAAELGITGGEARASVDALYARGQISVNDEDGSYYVSKTPVKKTSAASQGGAVERREMLQASHPNLVAALDAAEADVVEDLPVEIVRPSVTPAVAAELWHEYQELTKAILDKSDYQDIKGKPYKKKSAWRKYARFFNISDRIIEERITNDRDGRVVEAKFVVEAYAANGRSAIGWGSCSITERSHEFDKKSSGGVTCEGPCDGRAHFDKPDNTIPATAHTRAKNRAISDIIGAGEASAEERRH